MIRLTWWQAAILVVSGIVIGLELASNLERVGVL